MQQLLIEPMNMFNYLSDNIVWITILSLPIVYIISLVIACLQVTHSFNIYKFRRDKEYWAISILNYRFRFAKQNNNYMMNFKADFFDNFAEPWSTYSHKKHNIGKISKETRDLILRILGSERYLEEHFGTKSYKWKHHKTLIEDFNNYCKNHKSDFINYAGISRYMADKNCPTQKTIAAADIIYNFYSRVTSLNNWGIIYHSMQKSNTFAKMDEKQFIEMMSKSFPGSPTTEGYYKKSIHKISIAIKAYDTHNAILINAEIMEKQSESIKNLKDLKETILAKTIQGHNCASEIMLNIDAINKSIHDINCELNNSHWICTEQYEISETEVNDIYFSIEQLSSRLNALNK